MLIYSAEGAGFLLLAVTNRAKSRRAATRTARADSSAAHSSGVGDSRACSRASMTFEASWYAAPAISHRDSNSSCSFFCGATCELR